MHSQSLEKNWDCFVTARKLVAADEHNIVQTTVRTDSLIYCVCVACLAKCAVVPHDMWGSEMLAEVRLFHIGRRSDVYVFFSAM